MCLGVVDHPSEESFPDDPIEEVFADVFEFDWHDLKLRETLSGVLNLGCAVAAHGLLVALELVFEACTTRKASRCRDRTRIMATTSARDQTYAVDFRSSCAKEWLWIQLRPNLQVQAHEARQPQQTFTEGAGGLSFSTFSS